MRFALLFLVACETAPPTSPPFETPPSPPGPTRIVEPAPPAPVPASPRNRVKTRALLEPWMPEFPERAVFLSSNTGTDRVYTLIDIKTRTLLRVAPNTLTVTLTTEQVDRVWTIVEAAWRATSLPPRRKVTDDRQLLVAVDGDQVMWIEEERLTDTSAEAQQLWAAVWRL